MGRGIALLLLQEMSRRFQKKTCQLKLIDVNPEGFSELKAYLKQHLQRFAEKQGLQGEDFVENSMLKVDCSASLEVCRGAHLIFEAAFEDIEVKTSLLKSVNRLAKDAWVLTNTSSIPIGILARQSGLNEKLIGFHFYNPPPVQKLIELIPSHMTSLKLKKIAHELASRLKKVVVSSVDVAGFIGNGHFSREIVFACQMVKNLEKKYPLEQAVYFVDSITRVLLLRPMGIFQLLDYVGLKIADQVLRIMRELLPDPALLAPLLEEWIAHGIFGGQTLSGAPLNGIFRYQDQKIEGIYHLLSSEYISLPQLPPLIAPMDLSWKKIQQDPSLRRVLPEYFALLREQKEEASQLAIDFLAHSKEIEELLVRTQVAHTLGDVGTVLKEGFHQLYAPHEVIPK
jgi:3-hydroxyacyl-CoA dehydrogenase